MVWMLLVLLYGVLKGFREITKKKAMEQFSMMEVLFFYSLIAFVMTIPTASDALELPTPYYFLIFIKSFIIFVAWILGFYAIKKMPISTYGVLDLSRVLFSTFMGVVVLHEVLKPLQIIGLVMVCTGLLLLQHKPQKKAVELTETENVRPVIVIAAFGSCILNATSGLLDKIYMKDVSSSQLQFWYMLFLVLLYLVFILVRREPLRLGAMKCGWIWLLSLMFVIADKALFIANSYPESRVSVMTLLKQAGCIVIIAAGKFIFKEKNTGYKLFCAAIIIAGITLGAI